jgi:hypothetical protein
VNQGKVDQEEVDPEEADRDEQKGHFNQAASNPDPRDNFQADPAGLTLRAERDRKEEGWKATGSALFRASQRMHDRSSRPSSHQNFRRGKRGREWVSGRLLM